MERRDFEIKVDAQSYILKLGNCAVVLFRYKQEVDYLAIDLGEDTLKAFDAPDACHWMAGYVIQFDENGVIERPTTMVDGKTFREVYGWNPAIVEKETPTEEEEEQFLDTITRDIDAEWGSQE